MTLNIKKSYINKTKEYLEDLRMELSKKQILLEEIKLLIKNQRVNESINFSEIGFKSCKAYHGIDDLLITIDTQKTLKEAQIDRIEHNIRMYELYSRDLTKLEKKIISMRYLESNHKKSFREIAEILSFSKSAIAKKHDRSIEKLAFYIYGEDAKY